jgi:hypothetical protein
MLQMTEKMLIFHTSTFNLGFMEPNCRNLLRHLYERVSVFLSHLPLMRMSFLPRSFRVGGGMRK